MNEREIDGLIVAALRGGDVDWQALEAPDATQMLLYRADFHGVTLTLSDVLAGDPAVPAQVAAGLRSRAVFAFGWDAEHRRVVSDLLERLDAAGIVTLILKGTALAHQVYPDSAERMRGDTDLLVAEADRHGAERVLGEAGYRRLRSFDDDETSTESGHILTGATGAKHMIDLHWDVTNSSFLSGLFPFDDLRARAVPVPALSPRALAPGPADALMIACVHRHKHLQAPYYVDGRAHYDADRLVWLRDIDLLVRALSDDEWADLVDRAADLELIATCFDGVVSAGRVFATPMPGALARAHSALAGTERPARYLEADGAGRSWMDFRARDGIAGKLGYLRRLFFPSADYMRERYPDDAGAPLAWLYLRRAVTGVFRRLRRSG